MCVYIAGDMSRYTGYMYVACSMHAHRHTEQRELCSRSADQKPNTPLNSKEKTIIIKHVSTYLDMMNERTDISRLIFLP